MKVRYTYSLSCHGVVQKVKAYSRLDGLLHQIINTYESKMVIYYPRVKALAYPHIKAMAIKELLEEGAYSLDFGDYEIKARKV